MVLTDEQKNDDLIKSLLDSGFSEEVIAGWIDSGSIKLEKSVQDGSDDHGEGDGDGENEKDIDKKDDDLAKSISSDVMKSIEENLLGKVSESQDELLKSIPGMIEKALDPVLDKIEKSLDGMRQAIIAFGDSAPSFKTAGLNKAIIEKSLGIGSAVKDEDNKTVLSVSRDRAVVRDLISKSIDEESDPEIQKSLRENTTAYLLDPVYGEIGKEAALYMYNKKNIRLVK